MIAVMTAPSATRRARSTGSRDATSVRQAEARGSRRSARPAGTTAATAGRALGPPDPVPPALSAVPVVVPAGGCRAHAGNSICAAAHCSAGHERGDDGGDSIPPDGQDWRSGMPTPPRSVEVGRSRPETTRRRTWPRRRPQSEGLSAEEREAVKDRAKELRAEAKAGKNRAAGEKVLLEAIAALEGDDKALAEGFRRGGRRGRAAAGPQDLLRDARVRERGGEGRRLPSARLEVQDALFDDRVRRTRRTWTTATCGRHRSPCSPGRPPSRSGCASSWRAAVS